MRYECKWSACGTCELHSVNMTSHSLGSSLTRHPGRPVGLHHLNGPLSIITASVTLGKTQPRLLIQGVGVAAPVTGLIYRVMEGGVELGINQACYEKPGDESGPRLNQNDHKEAC